MSEAHFLILRFRDAACLVKSGTHPGRNSEINANFAYIKGMAVKTLGFLLRLCGAYLAAVVLMPMAWIGRLFRK